jgi:hypothetical protein
VLYVNRAADDDDIVEAFAAFGEFIPSDDASFSHRLPFLLHAVFRPLLSVAAACLRRRRLLTAAAMRLKPGRDENNDGFLDSPLLAISAAQRGTLRIPTSTTQQ